MDIVLSLLMGQALGWGLVWLAFIQYRHWGALNRFVLKPVPFLARAYERTKEGEINRFDRIGSFCVLLFMGMTMVVSSAIGLFKGLV